MQGLKPRLISPLVRAKDKWVNEIPLVLWSQQTTRNISIGYTPLFVVYGAEALVPSGIKYDSPRVLEVEEEAVEESQKDDIDAN